MQITLDGWQLFLYVAGLAGALITAFYGLQTRLAASQRETAKAQYDGLSDQIATLLTLTKGQGDEMRRIERELMALKAELPRDYVRREDYMQAIATIHVKLESIALRVEAAISSVANKGSKQ